MSQSLTIPTTLFSGFLGSGKTTIITHLVEQLRAKKEVVVYIKNEIGETDIDTEILRGENIATKELLNGCICCTLVGPFISAIDEVVELYQPDRIIIEASGAADPAALALMINSHPKLSRDGVICIIDVLNFDGYKDLSTTAQNQTQFTDLIVFNKVELATLEQKRAAVGYVRELNTHSPIIETHQGTLAAALVFGLNSKELDGLLAKTDKETHEQHTHIEDDQFEAFTIEQQGVFVEEKLLTVLTNLPKTVFRAKGCVRLTDDQLYIFNTVAGRTTMTKAPEHMQDRENTCIFIGYQARQYQDQIAQALQKIIT